MVYLIPQGGLGNLILQHNAAYTYARDNNEELQIWIGGGTDRIDRPNIFYYKDLFKHAILTEKYENPIYEEPNFTYDPIPNDVKTLKGFFQSWKYFQKYELEIRDLLISNVQNIYDSIKEKYNEISLSKKTSCVHIRRGDYVSLQNYHPLVEETFFKSVIDKTNRLIVFSDAIEEVRNWKTWTNCDVYFVEDVPGALETLLLMSLCDDFIISNSSLSLTAYFMRAKREAELTVWHKWFGVDGPKYRIEDIVPSGTNIIREPIVLFYTCLRNKHKWLHNTANGIIVTGDPLIKNEYEWNSNSRRLILKCQDNYDNLSKKTYCAIKAIKKLFNPISIIKQDDDVLLNVLNFNRLLNIRNQYFGKEIIIDKRGYISYDGLNKFTLFENKIPIIITKNYCAGPLYGLGYQAIRIISLYMDPNSLKYEDANVGMTLYNHGIYPVNITCYTDNIDELEETAGFHIK